MVKLKPNKKYALFAFVWLAFGIMSCQNQRRQDQNEKHKKDMGQWEGVSRKHVLGDMEFSATDIPLRYFITKSTGISDEPTLDSIYQISKKERVIAFEFRPLNEKKRLQEQLLIKDHESYVKHMAFGIREDFFVITSSQDTVPCTGVNFEQDFKVAPFERVLLYFNNVPPQDKISLIYNDRLYNKGAIHFDFTEGGYIHESTIDLPDNPSLSLK